MKLFFVASLAFLCVVTGVFAGEAKYCTGIEMGEDGTLHLSYHPTPYAEGKTFERMRSGEYTAEQLDDWFNSSKRFGKVGHLSTTKDVKIGEIHVPAGEYECGLNADGEGNFSFVVWTGEGEEEEAHKTPLELSTHDAMVHNLSMMLTPHEEQSALFIMYGSHHGALPVSVGGASEAGSDSAKPGSGADKKKGKDSSKKT